MEKQSFWEKKIVTATIGIIALVAGALFISLSYNDINPVTGNIVLGSDLVFGWVSVIGVLLVLCSIILIIYSIKKK